MIQSIYQNRSDLILYRISVSCAFLVLLVVVLLLNQLVNSSTLAIQKFGFKFLVTQVWDPVKGEFGALSSVLGTLMSTCIALVIALPISIVVAIFLVELAPPVISQPMGIVIELLAAIPSIIYGMWGLFVFVPFMAKYVQPFLSHHLGCIPLFSGPPIGIGMLSAGIVLAIMIIPFISAMMRDIYQMVPDSIKESAFGMGATSWEVASKVSFRYGLHGLLGAGFLGLGRAIGETMAITFVIGNHHAVNLSLFAPGNTIGSTLANEFTEAADPIYLSALVELGLILYCLTFVIQLIAHYLIKRVRKRLGMFS